MDSDNAYPSSATVHQRTPGPDGGLTVEARLNVRDYPWISDDAQNGFRVLVGHTSMSVGASPIAVPHGSETYIKVIAEKHALASQCALHGDLRFPYGPDRQYMYYDPEGESCSLTNGVDAIEKVVGCHQPGYLYHPNASVVCSPQTMNMLINAFVEQDYTKTILASLSSGRGAGLSDTRASKFFNDTEATFKGTFNKKTFCPHHCEYWTYRSTASFNYLEREDDEAKVDYMFSKIHIYYGSFDYRQHWEVAETPPYLAFCNFGNVVGLYWGMSIVSFFHVFYYVPRYFYVKRKVQKIEKSDQTVVESIATSKV